MTACRTSKYFQEICQNPKTWVHFLNRDYQIDFLEKSSRNMYRSLYEYNLYVNKMDRYTQVLNLIRANKAILEYLDGFIPTYSIGKDALRIYYTITNNNIRYDISVQLYTNNKLYLHSIYRYTINPPAYIGFKTTRYTINDIVKFNDFLAFSQLSDFNQIFDTLLQDRIIS